MFIKYEHTRLCADTWYLRDGAVVACAVPKWIFLMPEAISTGPGPKNDYKRPKEVL